MPYIQTRTNVNISEEKKVKIKEMFGEAISILRKSENWLMVEFVDVKIYGNGNSEIFNQMTNKVTEILNGELGILPENIYVSYLEYSNWGWNGSNF